VTGVLSCSFGELKRQEAPVADPETVDWPGQRALAEMPGGSSVTSTVPTFLEKRLHNVELIAFARGVAVGAPGALTVSHSYHAQASPGAYEQ
jgi:hypothetical protein